jgi:hypothetical protein
MPILSANRGSALLPPFYAKCDSCGDERECSLHRGIFDEPRLPRYWIQPEHRDVTEDGIVERVFCSQNCFRAHYRLPLHVNLLGITPQA